MSFFIYSSSIRLEFSCGGQRYRIYTGLKANHWDRKKQRCKPSEDFAWEINEKLDKIDELVEAAIIDFRIKGITPDEKELSNAVDRIVNEGKNHQQLPKVPELMWEFVPIWIQRNKKLRTEGYLKNWPSFGEQLKEYAPLGTFADISQNWQQDFAKWLTTEKGLSHNTVANKIKYLHILARDAMRMGLTVHRDFDLYRMKEITFPVIWLDWETDVAALRKLETFGHLEQVRDRFLFRCNTGMREGEMNQLRPEHFTKKKGMLMLKYWDLKGKKWKSISLNAEAQRLAEKYSFKFPEMVNQYENLIIKQVCLIAGITQEKTRLSHRGGKVQKSSKPLYQHVTTHTARRTFARRWYEQGGDLVKLSRYLGHSSIITTMRYIAVQDDEANDEMMRVMA